jgi:putative transposase
LSIECQRRLIDKEHPDLSVSRQCELLGLSRSSLYYEPIGESVFNLELMRKIDEIHTELPFFGSPRVTAWLRRLDYEVNHKRIERLMRLMDIQAVYPQKRLNLSAPGHRIFPYLLKGLKITGPNQVWSADITYIRMRQGFMYLVAIIDWFSRYVLDWELSNSLDAEFCVRTLRRALRQAQPDIFNTDQGSQFGSDAFTELLSDRKIQISMDGRGRAFDNIFIERLWRSVKYEEVYLKDYSDGDDAVRNLRWYFNFYNTRRPHQSLDYSTPQEVHYVMP